MENMTGQPEAIIPGLLFQPDLLALKITVEGELKVDWERIKEKAEITDDEVKRQRNALLENYTNQYAQTPASEHEQLLMDGMIEQNHLNNMTAQQNPEEPKYQNTDLQLPHEQSYDITAVKPADSPEMADVGANMKTGSKNLSKDQVVALTEKLFKQQYGRNSDDSDGDTANWLKIRQSVESGNGGNNNGTQTSNILVNAGNAVVNNFANLSNSIDQNQKLATNVFGQLVGGVKDMFNASLDLLNGFLGGPVNNLKNAQNTVVNAAIYQPGATGNFDYESGTWCNQSTFDVITATGADLATFIGAENANSNPDAETNRWNLKATDAIKAMQANADDPDSDLFEIDAKTAQEMANQGFTVAAAWLNPDAEDDPLLSSHLSTVRPSNDPYDPNQGPSIANVGNHTMLNDTVANGFGIKKLNAVHYYYNPNQDFSSYNPSVLAKHFGKN